MCVFCKQSEKYLCNVDGGNHMCFLACQGKRKSRGEEILSKQMESFWPNEMRTRRVEGSRGRGFARVG